MTQQNLINRAIAHHSRHRPEHIALRGAACSLSYAELHRAINSQADAWHELCATHAPTMALAVENHPAWAILDLAALNCGIPLIPLPFFFSRTQWLHSMENAGATVLVTDQPDVFEPLITERISHRTQFELAGKLLTQFTLRQQAGISLPAGTAKITYTSGTTGNPKGVCLSVDNMLNVARSIAEATRLTAEDVHLNVLPLATLLENVAGIYAPLLAGATCVLLPGNEVGLSGATGLEVEKLLTALKQSQATTAIFTPELLHALTVCIESGRAIPNALRFLAVGGASVSPTLLERAQQLAIPVYEGYGLSECASVVALNVPGSNKIGSVGKVLPHVKVEFTDENEIVVTGNAYLGYVGEDNPPHQHIYTGDIGHLDDDGYLVISGRKKNIFITSFGRNVSPEWVERELKISPFIAQAAIFGEARPWNVAVIVPRLNVSSEQVESAVQAVNSRLPDYARVTKWINAAEPFTLNNRQLTSNGRNRRDMISQCYQDKINALYEGKLA